MSEAQNHPSERVFLSRLAYSALSQSDVGLGWSHVAEWIRSLNEEQACTAADLVRATALVQSYRDVIAAYTALAPSRMNEISRRSAGLQQGAIALGLLEQGWRLSDRDSALTMSTLLETVSKNPALPYLEKPAGTRAWSFAPELLELIEELRELDAQLPLPKTVDKALIPMLLQPAELAPDDALAQLEWIEANWSEWLSEDFYRLTQLSADVAAEIHAARLSGPGPAQPPGMGMAAGMGDNRTFGRPGDPGYVDARDAFPMTKTGCRVW